MSFYEVRFPINISYGSSGGPSFSTTIVGLDAGAEQRVARWSKARRKYDVSYGLKTYTDLQDLIEFYMSVKGAAYGFRYKDWIDFTTATDGRSTHTFSDVIVATASQAYLSGELTVQLKKRYSVTDGTTTTTVVTRELNKPVSGTVVMGEKPEGTITEINSSDFEVDFSTGIVTINKAVAENTSIYCGCEFDVPVRFTKSMDDLLSVSLESFDSGTTDSIELVELLDHSEHLDEYFYGGSSQLILSGDTTLSVTNGRVISYDPSSNGHIVTLQPPTDLSNGGPYFYIVNQSPSFEGFTINFSDSGDHEGTSTILTYNLPANTSASFWVYEHGDTSKQWKAWQSHLGT